MHLLYSPECRACQKSSVYYKNNQGLASGKLLLPTSRKNANITRKKILKFSVYLRVTVSI